MELSYDNKCSEGSLHQLSKQIASLEYFGILEIDDMFKHTLLPAICQATQLKGLGLCMVNEELIQPLMDVLPQFSNLQEIEIHNSILLLPLHSLSNISYLRISDYNTEDTTLCCYLFKLLNNNINTLRGVKLWYLDRIGIRSWTELLCCIQLCSKLVEIGVSFSSIESADVTLWCSAVSKCKSLVRLYFFKLTLYDRGLKSICEGLVSHPAIRRIIVERCKQTSVCCKYLMYLIPTLSQLENLEVDELSKPDNKPLEKLLRTADEWGIIYNFEINKLGIQSTSSEETSSTEKAYSSGEDITAKETDSSSSGEYVIAEDTNPNDTL